MNEIAILFKIRLKNLKGKRRNYIFNDFNYESSIFQLLILKINVSSNFSCLFCYLFHFYFLCFININLFLKLV